MELVQQQPKILVRELIIECPFDLGWSQRRRQHSREEVVQQLKAAKAKLWGKRDPRFLPPYHSNHPDVYWELDQYEEDVLIRDALLPDTPDKMDKIHAALEEIFYKYMGK